MPAFSDMQPKAVHGDAIQPLGGTASRVRRAAFIIALLLIYRLGLFIPFPGIDYTAVYRALGGFPGSGALARLSVLGLGLWPYIVASVFIQLPMWLVPGFGRMMGSGAGRTRTGLYIRLLTVLIAAFHADLIASSLVPFMTDASAVHRVAFVVTLTAGAMFAVWLSDRITRQGLGDGVLLILFADIVAEIPRNTVLFFEYVRMGKVSMLDAFASAALMLAIIAGIAFVELGRRRIPVLYPRGGAKRDSAGNSYLPMKINGAGVVPPLFAYVILTPFMYAYVLLAPSSIFDPKPGQWTEWLGAFAALVVPGQPLYEAISIAVIVIVAFYFARAIRNPRVAAEKLEASGGVIPGVRPGLDTADYIARVSTRIAVVGAAYLAAVCLLPWILPLILGPLPASSGGFPLLVVAIAALDILRRFR